MRLSLVVLVLGVIGCGYDATGQGPGDDEGPGPTTRGSSSSDGDGTRGGEGSSTTVVLDGSGSSSGGGSTATTSSETGGSTTGEPLPTARSCAELLEEDRSAATGMHAILHERGGMAVDVWCEMELDGGGWTLVARSAPGREEPFGWGVALGTVGDVSAPYSLDAMGVGLPFTEVLVGRYTGFATPDENAYVIDVPAGFVDEYRDQAYGADPVRTVVGSCQPPDGPRMLRWLGYTADEEKYFFRDISVNDGWGLFSDGLRTFYDDCAGGGDLDDEHGVLFVR